MCTIRLLKPGEIEVRVQQVIEKAGAFGAILLLYKDSRTDMAILDETFGMFGWQREHSFKDNKNYCKVSIWDENKKQWVYKEDIGTVSNTEAEKGEASDAFKRACFNVGIGRELYTSPFIWVKLKSEELYQNNRTQKWQLKPSVRFFVDAITYSDERSIESLRIVDHEGCSRFEYPHTRAASSSTTPPATPPALMEEPKKKNSVTMYMLDDEVKCECLLHWAYNFYLASSYDPNFDAGTRLKQSYDADERVVSRFRALFESYKTARANAK